MEKLVRKWGHKGLGRFLSDEEINLVHKVETAAGFWEVKEAAIKATGCTMGDVRIEKRKGIPVVFVRDAPVAASISHDGNFAIAVVMA